MKTNIKKSTWIILGSVAAAVVIVLIVVLSVNSGLKYYDFYYPDNHYRKLGRESRAIKVQGKSGTPLETKIIKEYILGPVHYSLKLVIRDDISVLNVWVVQDKAIYINFNGGFGKYLQDNGDDCQWFVRGLRETLRVNTPFESMVILVNYNKVHESAGEFKLSGPIRIKNPKK